MSNTLDNVKKYRLAIGAGIVALVLGAYVFLGHFHGESSPVGGTEIPLSAEEVLNVGG